MDSITILSISQSIGQPLMLNFHRFQYINSIFRVIIGHEAILLSCVIVDSIFRVIIGHEAYSFPCYKLLTAPAAGHGGFLFACNGGLVHWKPAPCRRFFMLHRRCLLPTPSLWPSAAPSTAYTPGPPASGRIPSGPLPPVLAQSIVRFHRVPTATPGKP